MYITSYESIHIYGYDIHTYMRMCLKIPIKIYDKLKKFYLKKSTKFSSVKKCRTLSAHLSQNDKRNIIINIQSHTLAFNNFILLMYANNANIVIFFSSFSIYMSPHSPLLYFSMQKSAFHRVQKCNINIYFFL